MKKFYWIIALLVLVFVGDRIAGMVLKNMTTKSQFRYSRMYTGNAKSDLLLVGNSRGLIFYQPYIEEITGKSTFNISYNGMPVDLATTLVEDYFERYDAPEKMIIDVSLCDRINKELITGFNAYGSFSSRLDSFIIASNATMGYAARVSHLFRYNSEIFQRALFYYNKSDEDWLLDRVINQNLIDGISKLDTFSINLEPDSTDRDYLLRSLKSMVTTAQAQGTKVDLVINPYYPAFASKITNLATFKRRIEAYIGLPVRDYSTAITERNGFGDYQHLNKTGAKAYLDRLYQDGILK